MTDKRVSRDGGRMYHVFVIVVNGGYPRLPRVKKRWNIYIAHAGLYL